MYAHSAEDLRPLPASQRWPHAPHWHGLAIDIGVVEIALSSDPPAAGTSDVVCNRTTCLGNPFATRIYAPNEEVPPTDGDGWRAAEHEDLVAAYAEYLDAVLDQDSLEDLPAVVDRICEERSVTHAGTWVVQRLQRADILRSLEGLEDILADGGRLRLLCHCRPHVRCHTELLKAHLEGRVPASAPLPALPDDQRARLVWPSLDGEGPKCVQCGRRAQALDPADMSRYCSFCWMDHAERLGWRAGKWVPWKKRKA